MIDLVAAGKAATPGGLAELPADMKDLIARYDAGLRARILAIVARVEAAASRPAYAMDLAGVRTLPPIRYPTTMLNVAVNYREHGLEMAGRDSNAGAPAGQRAASGPGSAPAGHDQHPRASGSASPTSRAGIPTCSSSCRAP